MKISLFALISTIICLYFGQAPNNTSAPRTFPNTVEEKASNSVEESDNTIRLSKENKSDINEVELSKEETEAYLDFVRKQMQESIQEHLQNIQEKLGEQYDEKVEKLILM
ncbi:MAG: hypothetical protein R3E32_02495 [Chitinophagales bacterium]